MKPELELLIQKMKKELEMYKDHVSSQMGTYITEYVQRVQGEPEQERRLAADLLRGLCGESKALTWVYLQSAAVQIDLSPEAMHAFLVKVRECPELTLYNKSFLLSQSSNLIFRHPELDSVDNTVALEELLEWVCENFYEKTGMELMEIPFAERNQRLVVVVTAQFIGTEHGPTKTALDRCAALIRQMGKTVLLINTAEMTSPVGMVPWYGAKVGAYKPEFLTYEEQAWKGTRIPFYQCEQCMPDVDEYRALLTQILRLKPGMVLSIGTNSIFANMCRRLVPTLAAGTFPSKLSPTLMRYQTLGRPLNESDREFLRRRDKQEDSVLEGVFTYNLKEEESVVSRQDWQIPEDAFVMFVVGARLDDEVTAEFLKLLETQIDDHVFVVFAGVYRTYEEALKAYPVLYANSRYLGFQEDMLAVCGQCDLYVNPHRRGGGGSAVEAMSKGVPVVTTAFGDVSANVGEAFCVRDYDEMREQIMRYRTDPEFYRQMSELARRRTEVLLDSEGEFIRIIREAERREAERRKNV